MVNPDVATPDSALEPLLNAEDVGAILGIPAYTVRKMARENAIECVRTGKHWRFRPAAVRAYIADNTRPALATGPIPVQVAS